MFWKLFRVRVIRRNVIHTFQFKHEKEESKSFNSKKKNISISVKMDFFFKIHIFIVSLYRKLITVNNLSIFVKIMFGSGQVIEFLVFVKDRLKLIMHENGFCHRYKVFYFIPYMTNTFINWLMWQSMLFFFMLVRT